MKTNQYNLNLHVVRGIAVIVILLLFTNKGNAQNRTSKPSKDLLYPGEWHFKGHIGGYIDTIAQARLLSLQNWNIIYPETEDAFRIREDDKSYPSKGLWRGEFWGKYILSAIAAQRYYHSNELTNRIRGAVKGLLSTQDSNGYIGTYTHSNFVEGDNWNVWNRKYTLWGLIEAWQLLKDPTLLTSAEHFTDHLISEVGPNATNIVKTGNFYGMPSSSILYPIVKLYTATGKKRYLEYAKYIVDQWSKLPNGMPDILNKGIGNVTVYAWFPEPFQWAKGYELTSCVEGLVELFKVTGNENYFKAAENIHGVLVKSERTPVGSVSFDDKYIGANGLINTVSEICDAVYWNRLSYELFTLTGNEKYIAEIERTFYNSLLCAFKPDGTWGLRRLRMSYYHIPAHNHFLQNHQCCTDNLPRGLFQAADAALTSNSTSVFLSFFNEGEGGVVLASGSKVHFKTEGDYLNTSRVAITVSLNKSEKFNLKLRIPQWSKNTIVKVNNIVQKENIANNWMTINRNWKNGDVIEVLFTMGVRWELFDTTRFAANDPIVEWHKKQWSSIVFKKGSNATINSEYSHIPSLSSADALPQIPAITFFYGPIALARDVRITDSDIFSTVALPENAAGISISPIKAPAGIWKAFQINLKDGQKLKFCDFSSAGNTWNEASLFNTWCIIK